MPEICVKAKPQAIETTSNRNPIFIWGDGVGRRHAMGEEVLLVWTWRFLSIISISALKWLNQENQQFFKSSLNIIESLECKIYQTKNRIIEH